MKDIAEKLNMPERNVKLYPFGEVPVAEASEKEEEKKKDGLLKALEDEEQVRISFCYNFN